MKPGRSALCAGSCCGVNGPVEGVLIDSFSQLSFSLTPVPRAACISPGSPRCLPCVPLPLPVGLCRGTGGRESPKPGPGSHMSGIRLLLHVAELVMIMVCINPLLRLVFTAFAA